MKSQSLLDETVLVSEDKWQKHVVVALWICVALLIAITGMLLYGKAHGLFESFPADTRSLPPWPTGF